MQQDLVTIYADGACKGNPGIGGWGAILSYGQAQKEIYGAEPNTTNNRMELTAVIMALKQLKRHCNVAIYTDSQYVQKGISEWINGWRQKNWRNVKNVDLWQELDELNKQHQVTWHWVRGHNGNNGNERADTLANIAVSEYLSQQSLGKD